MGLAALRLEVLSLLHVYLMGTDTSVCNVMQEDVFCRLGNEGKCALGGYSCPLERLPCLDDTIQSSVFNMNKLDIRQVPKVDLQSFKVQQSSAYFGEKIEVGHGNHPEYWKWLQCNGI